MALFWPLVCGCGRGSGPAQASEPQVAQRSEAPAAEAAPPVEAANPDPTAAAAAWPCWRGPHGNGTSAETGLVRTFPEAGPKVVWRARLGTGFAGLTVAAGRLYTLFGEEGREKIACFDAAAGTPLWKVDSDADFAQGRSFGPRATPCVDGDRVYTVGASGMLRCQQAASGEEVWSFNIYDRYGMKLHEEGLSCSPQIDGPRLIVLAGRSAFAFDKTNGELLWRALDEPMNHSTPTLAAIGGRPQWVVLSGSHLVGLDPATGAEQWRHRQEAVNCASPVVGPDDQIFTAAAYGFGCQLVQIEGGNARQVYKNMALATHHGTAILHEGHLYGFDDRPGIFKCVEFATGNEKWVSRSPGKGKMILADGQLIIVTEGGELVLGEPSPEGFSTTASIRRVLRGTCFTDPSLVNGLLYLRSDEELVCIAMKE